MVYKNDQERLEEVKKDALKKILALYLFSLILASFSVFVAMEDLESFLFVFFMTAIGGGASLFFALFLARKRSIKEFSAYEISIDDEQIVIKNLNNELKIIKDKIAKITINSKNEITICTKFSHIKLSKYIASMDLLQRDLERIAAIETRDDVNKIFQYLPEIFFVGLLLIKFVPDVRLYLISAIGFVLTTILSTIHLFLTVEKKKQVIYSLVINSVLLAIVVKNIVDLIFIL